MNQDYQPTEDAGKIIEYYIYKDINKEELFDFIKWVNIIQKVF